MRTLDLTLSSPQENLALEEALLEWAESSHQECLRFWESPTPFVVMGAGCPHKTDVNLEECSRSGIPVLRRCSGGGTVIQGPGCLNYTFVLDRERRDTLESISSTTETVLTSVIRALGCCGVDGISIQGYSDLTTGPLKFSGNAQRRRKRFVLFHGTILHSFDMDLVDRYLGTPEKAPEYRGNRSHQGFLTNIAIDPFRLRREIASCWKADDTLIDWPEERTKELARTKYADQAWIESI